MDDLVGFERAAYERTPDRVTRMIAVLRRTAAGRLTDGPGAPADIDAPPAMEAMTGRLAAAIAAVLADPGIEPSIGEIEELILFSGTIRQLFEIAGFGGTDFLLRLLGDIAWNAPIGQIAKRFLLLSLDSSYDWRPAMLANALPHLGWGTLAALVATRPIATRRGMAMKERLLEAAATMPPARFPLAIDQLVLISLAWMLCSYSASPRKHAIKAPLNAALRAMATAWGLEDIAPAGRRTRRERPLLLFAAEVINSTHVQYRYFGRYLRQLRERFDLVLLTEEREADPPASALFDRVLTFERGEDARHLHRIHRMIADTAPDIIFYPSVGMRHWGPLFANLRLAPIQMTGLGHSASTFCETIDYYLLEEGYVSDPALFGETVMTLADESLVFERPPHYRPREPAIRAAPQPLRIAFPSNLLKLNPDFLAVVARIGAAARRPLEFHFLPNADGLELDAGRRVIAGTLPGATVHGMVPYPDYLAVLSACDLVLSPFPFGGLHSVVDALRQGLPVVAMECAEPHGRTDAMLLRRLGLPEWLIAANEEDYVAAALRVIADDALRIELSEQALALDIDRLMFGDASTPLRSEVRDAVWWIHRHHEAAQADGRKLWSEADRSAFDGAASG